MRIQPATASCLFLSHVSAERGAELLLRELESGNAAAPSVNGSGPQADASNVLSESVCNEGGNPRPGALPAVLNMGLRLGEGTGAVLCLPLLRSAAAMMTHMASLKEVLDGS